MKVRVRKARRWLRRRLASALGLPGHVDLWWTPQLPVVYVSNPKCGCSTVKNSLKRAQASRYRRDGHHGFEHLPDPHHADDCLKRQGIARIAGGSARLVISCARNPYARILSAYLDKVEPGTDIGYYLELRGRRPESFESFLATIAEVEPAALDPHFCPQHINLGLPHVDYDAVFYLENCSSLHRALTATLGEFEFSTFAPHSRSAQEKMHQYYTPGAIELAQRIYARDFALLGYSRDISRVTDAPGSYWTSRGIVAEDDERELRPGAGLATLRPAIRYQHLIEARLI